MAAPGRVYYEKFHALYRGLGDDDRSFIEISATKDTGNAGNNLFISVCIVEKEGIWYV